MGRQLEVKTHLRRVRLMDKLPAHVAAARLDISRSTLMQMELGHTRPSQELRARFANLYGLPENMLFDDNGYPLKV